MLPSSRLRSHEYGCQLRRGSPKPSAKAAARRSHHVAGMTRPSLAARVTALEEKVGNKTMQEQFRDQAELIDRRFEESFRSQAELIDRLFLVRDQKWDVRFGRIENDVSALKKDMTIVREGIGILLKRRG